MAAGCARHPPGLTGSTLGELMAIGAVAGAVFALAAAAQAISGFGSALVAIPLLALAIGPDRAVVSATAVSPGR